MASLTIPDKNCQNRCKYGNEYVSMLYGLQCGCITVAKHSLKETHLQLQFLSSYLYLLYCIKFYYLQPFWKT